MSDAAPTLDVRGLWAGYGDTIVVRNLDLRAETGRTVVMIGPNGHGKTTFLRAVSGLIRPARGEVWLGGERIDGKTPESIARMGLVHVLQGDGLFADMTVEENLLMGAFPTASWGARRSALERVYDLFPQVRERRGQRSRTLSGGERRLVGLGRGLMREARILLIDEPSLGLAPVMIDTVYGAIREIRERLGTTILLVEENFTHIGGVADVVHVVEMGGIVRSGSLEELSSDRTVVETYLGSLLEALMSNLVAILISTIVLGSIYGLVAIGMTLIYGTLRILDMSQGSMVMIGGFVAWGVLVVANSSPVLAILAAFAVTFVLGTFTQLISVQPLMSRRNEVDFEMVTFITTFAVAIVFSNVALQVFGPFQKNVRPVISGSVSILGQDLSLQSVAMALTSIALMGALGLFLARTRWGLAIRAVAQDLDAARSMGVPVGKLYPLTMGLASALAGIGGVFLGAQFFASPTAGDLPLLQALIVVIFGGLGSLSGTLYAAYAIGLIQSAAIVTIGETWTLPVLYGVILLVLIFRPYGLKGSPSEARL